MDKTPPDARTTEYQALLHQADASRQEIAFRACQSPNAALSRDGA
mgnify:CR=1 FL=1